MLDGRDRLEKVIDHEMQAPGGMIKVVSPTLTQKEKVMNALVRQGFKRNDYKIQPGLYAIGRPRPESDVFVTANYKLSFDALRQAEVNNCWVMVLDTHGINVWCAAGKGTFSTIELVRMIKKCQLEKVINHKRLILPQLGAVGTSAYKIKKMTGFEVVYGPVRASDLMRFKENDYTATRDMRTVSFGLADRALLTPLEFMQSLKYSLGVLLVVFIIGLLGRHGVSDLGAFVPHLLAIVLTSVLGSVIFPLLFPFLKGRWFTVKALPLTLGWASLVLVLVNHFGLGFYEGLGLILMGMALVEAHALNFTGATPVASYNETKKETFKMLPYLISIFVIGLIIYGLAIGQVIQ